MDWKHMFDSILDFIHLVVMKFINWINLDFWQCVFLAMFWMFIVFIDRCDKNLKNPVDVSDILIDTDVGKVTIKKLGALVALITSTWWTAKKSSDADFFQYAALYLFVWTGVYMGMPIASAYTDKLKAQAAAIPPAPVEPVVPPPVGTTEVTSTVTATEKIEVKPTGA